MALMFNSKVFQENMINETTKIVFVNDLYVEDYIGGAELTTQSLIDECPFEYIKLKSNEVTIDSLRNGHHCHWIFGNFAAIDSKLIPTIVGNMNYSILEYDYKYCKYRSPEKHESQTGTPCNCNDESNGKFVSAFFYGAKSLWWMSEKQKDKYHSLFPFLKEKDNVVLSSVFDKTTLGKIKLLRDQNNKREGWVVLGSDSWVKGAHTAKQWCIDNDKAYQVVWGISYDEMLAKLSCAEGFVYLPSGADTCPRMVIEAKLLGCELQLNENVQHKDEEWFATNDLDSISDYLYATPSLFWNSIKNIMNYVPKISGYITTYNCEQQGYPYDKSILSMLQFCDEVCVVDGGSTDGTPETLFDLQVKNAPKEARVKLIDDLKKDLGEQIHISTLHDALNSISRVKVKTITRDWTHPRHAVFDGLQKAEARAMCTGDFCWQMDSDEIVHENDAEKVAHLCKIFPKDLDILSLPVIEYWGGPEKVRVDIQPWKWRLSRNRSYITHGIPGQLRKTDSQGNLCALEGTDGCDMIHKETLERLPHATFHNTESENLRRAALSGDRDALESYKNWFNSVINSIPGVHHYSWYDISRKIKLYKGYWTRHWNSLYDKDLNDTAESNMMFDVPWSNVTDEMIDSLAKKLKEKMGGWIFHQKINFNVNVPSISVNVSEPSIMNIL